MVINFYSNKKKKNIFETPFHHDAHAHCNYFSHNDLYSFRWKYPIPAVKLDAV